MLPDEKVLVQRLKDQPFALIGINSDVPADKELAKVLKDKPFEQKLEPTRKYVKAEILDKNGITWRNAIDCGTDGPLATKWNIQGWPSLFVVDATGKIRYRGYDGKEMDKMVELCMSELQAKAPPKK